MYVSFLLLFISTIRQHTTETGIFLCLSWNITR